MNANLDAVLARVAAGELTPDEALALLEPPRGPAAGGPPTHDGAPRASFPPPSDVDDGPGPSDDSALHRVVLRTASRSVQIWGDPSVAEISISGSHELHRDGDAIVIENESAIRTDEPGRFTIASTIARAIPGVGENLVVRINPSLFLDIDAAASSFKIAGLHGGLRLRLLASAAKLDDVSGSFDIEAISSSVKGNVTFTGQNRIDCESSSVKVSLGPDSDVHIRARNRMGKIVLPTFKTRGSVTEPDLTEVKVGRGRGSLTIDAVMSSVMIGADR